MVDAASESSPSRYVVSRYLKALSELKTFVEFSWFGIHHLAGQREFAANLTRIKASKELDADALEKDEFFQALIPPKELEAFAVEQNASDFHYLYSIAVVRLWSIIESAVEDVVLDVIRRIPTSSLPEKIRSLRGPLIEFTEASADDQFAFIIELLKQDLKTGLKPGVGRFEALLEAVGYGGPVNQSVRRTLLELSQIRNVLVHKDGKVDRRLLDTCPWLTVDKGQILRVKANDFQRYLFAVYWYVGELMRRCLPLWASADQPNQEPDVLWKQKGEPTQAKWLEFLERASAVTEGDSNA